MQRKDIFQLGFIYHVYNRGNKKELIFLEARDYYFYLERLEKYANETGFKIICYCLMPNHIHLCIKQGSSINPSTLILKLHTSYSMYFNNKYHSVGHVFQKNFRFKLVDTDAYLLYLSFYIHTNAYEITKDVFDYPFCSLKEMKTENHKGALCDFSAILNLYEDSNEYYKDLKLFLNTR